MKNVSQALKAELFDSLMLNLPRDLRLEIRNDTALVLDGAGVVHHLPASVEPMQRTAEHILVCALNVKRIALASQHGEGG